MTATMTDAEREARRRWAAQTERAWMAADAAEREEAQAEADRCWREIVGFETARTYQNVDREGSRR